MLNPFSRTSVVIVSIIAAFILVAGIITLLVVFPDSEGRITAALTITLPVALLQVVNMFNQRKTNATVQANSQKLDTTVAQTNGIVNRLLDHVDGTVTLDTAQMQAIKAKVRDVRGTADNGGQ